jgi:predicted ATPase
MDTFGEWLRSQRDQRHLTREQFASRVGCSVALLRKIEAGERRPSEQIAGLLANCLDIPPAERATFVQVARGELSVERLSPVMKPVAAWQPPRANLPALPAPLIGRHREVEQLAQLLRDPLCRLLTLVGPGGIGKTHLAIETAAHAQDGFAGGVFFVPLAPANSTRLIVPVVAGAIGFGFQSASRANPKSQLFAYLREKQVLLLADSLEHLLAEPGIEVLAELLADAPRVKILATSRESSGLPGEWVFEVQGLPAPGDPSAAGFRQNPAVALFLQRARRAQVEFKPAPEDYPAIARICQLADGMPLGIELAAAWVRTLSCAEIAREIEGGLDFLRGSARELPSRHRSLRAVFDHSWKLLAEEEQAILRRLSAFRGGFRREAAEAVAGVTLPALSALVAKSLVHWSGPGRYDLHELIQQFSAERLAGSPAEQDAARARHGRYYLAYFAGADGRLRSSLQAETLAGLAAEQDNFRSAWDWAVAHGEFALIEQTIRVFALFYDLRGWLQEGLDLLGRAAAALETALGQSPPDRTRQVALGHILAARALLASRLGQYEQAQAMLERSLEILRPLDEPRVLVEAVAFLGIVLELAGDYPRAFELYSEGLELAAAVGDRWFEALSFTCRTELLGIAQNLVEPEITHQNLQAAVASWRAIGDPRLIAIALNLLSWNGLTLGCYAEARAALEESVALSLSVGDRYGLGFAHRGLGIIAQTQGEHRQAVERFQQSLETLAELGARQDVARVLAELGRSLFALGDEAGAGRAWLESLRLAVDTLGTFIALEALAGLASLQAQREADRENALALLFFILDHPATIQDTKDRAARSCAELEAQLTGQRIEAARSRAQAITFETAVAEVLEQAESAQRAG